MCECPKEQSSATRCLKEWFEPLYKPDGCGLITFTGKTSFENLQKPFVPIVGPQASGY